MGTVAVSANERIVRAGATESRIEEPLAVEMFDASAL